MPTLRKFILAAMVILTCADMACGNEKLLPSVASVESAALLPNETTASAGSPEPDYLQQLQALLPGSNAVVNDANQDTYLQDLEQLLRQQSNWIYPKNLPDAHRPQGLKVTDGGGSRLNESKNLLQQDAGALQRLNENKALFVGLETPLTASVPAEPVQDNAHSGETYSSDLQKLLIHDSTVLPKTAANTPFVVGLETQLTESGPAAFVQAIVTDEDGVQADRKAVTAGDVFDELNTPLGEIQVTGNSSSPPQEIPSLKPVNRASFFLEKNTVPACYQTTGYGVRTAPRNTLRFYHNPLYFEDPNLERCGRSHGCLTTASSTLLFAAKIFMTPYLTAVNHPTDCVAALPDCPSCHKFGCDAYWPGWSLKGAAAQGVAVTGLFYVIP